MLRNTARDRPIAWSILGHLEPSTLSKNYWKAKRSTQWETTFGTRGECRGPCDSQSLVMASSADGGEKASASFVISYVVLVYSGFTWQLEHKQMVYIRSNALLQGSRNGSEVSKHILGRLINDSVHDKLCFSRQIPGCRRPYSDHSKM